MIPKSLTFRTIAAGVVSVAIALGVGGWIILSVFSASAWRQFDARLERHLDLLTAAIAASAQSPEPRMGAPDFERAFSGLYWQASGAGGTIYRSRSLWDSELVFKMGGEPEVRLAADGPDGQPLRLVARTVEGADQQVWILTVAADQTSLRKEVKTFRRTLLIYSAILAVALLGAAVIMLRAALSPLKTLREAVLERHFNEGEQISGKFPPEVQPLVDDLNTLLERNERLREKGRVQAANLAHALKTPAAILQNELDKARRGQLLDIGLAEEAVENVSAAAGRHLSLVTAGPDDMLGAQATDMVPVAEETIRALRRLFSDKSFILQAPDRLTVPLARSEQLEILGNLIENAGKWSRRQVSVRLANGQDHLSLTVEDDGDGVSPRDRGRIIRQGVRLDETQSGSGLGLTIVSDIVERHKGHLSLEASELGGLKVHIQLPVHTGTG
ncbi:MAG: HAMP domain-containing sensor histidine kinase [Pseudomonadota bacterium]